MFVKLFILIVEMWFEGFLFVIFVCSMVSGIIIL